MRLRIGTFNIHGGRTARGVLDLPSIAAALRGVDADLWGLQEVHRYLPPPGSFHDQPEQLRLALQQEVWFSPSIGWGPFGYGNAMLSRLAVRGVRSWRLPGPGERRVLVEAEVEIGARSVVVLNTHLGLSPDARLAQMERVCRVVTRAADEDRPLIALGDWNGSPDSPELRLLQAAGLAHTVPEKVFTFPSEDPVVRLDYVMVSPHFRIAGGGVHQTGASDHLPLYADLILDD